MNSVNQSIAIHGQCALQYYLGPPLDYPSLSSYDIMQKCWEADHRKRPSFSELRATFDAMHAVQCPECHLH